MQEPAADEPGAAGERVEFVNVFELGPEEYSDSCLMPLGMCELGGCCDVCTYGPNRSGLKG